MVGTRERSNFIKRFYHIDGLKQVPAEMSAGQKEDCMKLYVSDYIGDDYKAWEDGKIIIGTPCASGKTTFILKVLLPYYHSIGKRILMVCNRLALIEQYRKSLYIMSETDELMDSIEFITYQSLGSSAYGKQWLPQKYYSYDIYCFDEVHSLVEDDYNKTYYNLFKVICNTLNKKCLIFMSATLMSMEEYLGEYERKCKLNAKFDDQLKMISCTLPSWSNFFWYNQIPEDYSYIDMIGVHDETQLCDCLIEDVVAHHGQALIFAETEDWLRRIENLLKEKTLKKSQILRVNSKRLNGGELNDARDELLNGERFPNGVDVILSTKVLDNGITLRADGPFSICAFTSDKTEFIQMISRLRVNPGQRIKLYVMEVNSSLYANRIDSLEKSLEFVKKAQRHFFPPEEFDRLQANEKCRNLLYVAEAKSVRTNTISRNDKGEMQPLISINSVMTYAVNPFVRDKMRRTLFVLHKIQSGSYNNPKVLAEEQATWLGFDKDSISWLGQDHLHERLREFLIQNINDVDNTEYNRLVRDFAELCWKIPEFKVFVNREGASLCKDKIKKICEKLGLKLTEERKNVCGKTRIFYTIKTVVQ